MCLYAEDIFPFRENFPKCLEAVLAQLPLGVLEIYFYLRQAGFSLFQPCHCPPHPQCFPLTLNLIKHVGRGLVMLEPVGHLQGKGAHSVSEHWAQCRDEVMDNWTWERGTTVSLELSWSHTGPGACGVVHSPRHMGDISTVKVGGEGTGQLRHLVGNLKKKKKRSWHLPGLWGSSIPLLTQRHLDTGDVTCAPALVP